MPCPHFDVKIIQRSKRQSAVASAAYQSGERLFSEYDQKQKYYSHKSEIVHTEIMLPPHAPPEYADRNSLWNAAEAIEKQWNSQLARRFVLAIPRELPPEQYADLIRDYCREFFVSKGMIADFAIHDKGDGNPHAHILLTMRAMDETGKWLPKSRKVYDLDENGERMQSSFMKKRSISLKKNSVLIISYRLLCTLMKSMQRQPRNLEKRFTTIIFTLWFCLWWRKKSYGVSVAKMKNCEERLRKWFIKSAIQRNGNRIFR